MSKITRRGFLAGTGGLAACVMGAALSGCDALRLAGTPSAPALATPPTPWSIEAQYYISTSDQGSLNCTSCHEGPGEDLNVAYCHVPHTKDFVRCTLCPHACLLTDGQRGLCRVRENRAGRLYSLVYGNPCAVHSDPIEKKPFYHFLPGATAYSLATAGCSLRCLYCQNWSISQATPEETQNTTLAPGDAVRAARHLNAPVIAYTYSEPAVFFEYMLAIARAGREAGLRSAVVSSGFINVEPLQELCRTVDAIKIDLKGYDEGFYRKVCGAELQPVLQAIQTIQAAGVHLEIVNLVVPTLNDNLDQLQALARWLKRDVSADVPLHFTRFLPQYKLSELPPTPVETLEQARQAALAEGLRFVYTGNVPSNPGDNTYCPTCGRPVILRQGFAVQQYLLQAGKCPYCGTAIPGVWWPERPPAAPTGAPPRAADS